MLYVVNSDYTTYTIHIKTEENMNTKYQSKKDPTVTAILVSQNEKYNTVSMQYVTGDDEGKNFDVSLSTLKRWWKKMNDDNVDNVTENSVPANDTSDVLKKVDMDVVNQPYHPDVTPHYIPKPDSVVEYENNKRKRKFNEDLPDYETICETFNEFLKKVNASYIRFKDGKGSTIFRKGQYIDIYATEELLEPLTRVGLTSSANKDKDRPFHFRISTMEDYNKAKKAIIDYFSAED